MTDDSVSSNSRPKSTSLTLLERARQNEEEAWKILVELYAPLVYQRCRKTWKLSAPDSENVGQEVFGAVARKLVDFQRVRTGSFRKWLRTIVDNKCKDFFRKEPNAAPIGGSNAKDLIENIPGDSPESELETELSERATLMRHAAKKVEGEFSDRDWKIFWLITIENRDRQLTALDLGVSDNVVYLVCSRIRKRLKEIYQDLVDEDIFAELPSPPL